MTLTLAKIDHGDLCHGWSWTVADENELAERVARIALGQYRHVAKILSGAGVAGPTATTEQAKAAIKLLTRGKNEEPWHRDGWIFQAISWIAASQAPSGSLTRAPHIRRADKGFDGLQLELSDDGKVVTAIVVFEDKATENARSTIREDVWPGIVALEAGERLNELTHEVSAMLDTRAATDAGFDVDAAIANILWKDARRYRVSVTINDTHNSNSARAQLFDGFDQKVPGGIERRRADTIYLPRLRDWMEAFAARVIAKVEMIAADV
ncbi:MAG TPA: hypothetical protein VGI47_07700 [Candidatus Binataceae bacterium]